MASSQFSSENYPHRGYRPKRDVEMVRIGVSMLVDRLLDLEAQTHPINGFAPGKEHDSVKALKYASQLFEVLVGWAVDHQAGLVLNDTEGFPWPEDDDKAQRLADDHKHEAAGSAYLRKIELADIKHTNRGDDAVTNRRVIAAVTDWAPVLPPELRSQLCDGLKALDMGDIQDLLQPTKRKSHTRSSYSLWQSRFEAIMHIWFSQGMKEKKKDAIARVAAAYGRSTEAVQKWEQNLPKHFGSGSVRYFKQHVSRAGKAVYSLQQTSPKREEDEQYIAHHLKCYGEAGLSRSAQEYKIIIKEIAKNR